MPIQLLDLPDEVLLKIISYLPSSSILTTLRVSKRFYQTYHASSLLQYIVALHTTQQEDVENCSLPPSEKLRLLRDRDARWKSLKWQRRQSMLCGPGHLSTVVDGVFIAGRPDEDESQPGMFLRFYKMPSAFEGIGVIFREFHCDAEIHDFHLDLSQDLLVLVDRCNPVVHPFAWRMRFCSFSTFEPHPLAHQHSLTFSHETVTGDSSMATIYVETKLVFLLVSPSVQRSDYPGRLGVWDWRKGVSVWNSPATPKQDIMALSSLGPYRLLICAYDWEALQASVLVYSMDPLYSPSNVNSSDAIPPAPTLLATFELPTTDQPPEDMEIEVGLKSSNGVFAPCEDRVDVDSRTAFKPDDKECLISIDMIYDDPTAISSGFRRFCLFALKSFFLQASTPLISSPELGSIRHCFEGWQEHCRVIPDIPSDLDDVCVYGCACIHPTARLLSDNVEDFDFTFMAPRILDFSPFSVSRLSSSNPGPAKRTTSSSILGFTDRGVDTKGAVPFHGVYERADGDVGRLVELPTIAAPCRIFKAGLQTGAALPYVERQMKEVPVIDSTPRGTACVSMDEQRIIMLQCNGLDEIVLDVLMF